MGMQGMGSNGLGIGGSSGGISPSLLAMLMGMNGSGGGGTGGANMAPTLLQATRTANSPNPMGQVAQVQSPYQANTGAGVGGAGNSMLNLASLLKSMGNGQTGLSPTGQNTSISDMGNILAASPASSAFSPFMTAAGQNTGNTPGNFVPVSSLSSVAGGSNSGLISSLLRSLGLGGG